MINKILAGFLVLFLLGGGYHFYRIISVKKQIKVIAQKDNILFEEILTLDKKAPSMTFNELFEKAKKQVEEREGMVVTLKMIDPYIFQDKIKAYSELLNSENELVRLIAANARAMLTFNVKMEWANNSMDSLRNSSSYTLDFNANLSRKAIDEAKEAAAEWEKIKEGMKTTYNKLMPQEKRTQADGLVPKRDFIGLIETWANKFAK